MDLPQVTARRRTAVTFALLAISSMAACTTDDTSHGTTTDGGGTLVLDAADVHVVGSSSAIAMVQDLDVLVDGSAWVLNSSEPYFIGFSADGGTLGTHGQSGGGPEEFRAPSGFVTGRTGPDAWVLDVRRHALIRASEPEGPWSEIPLPRDALPPGTLVGGMSLLGSTVRSAYLGDEIVFARTARPEGNGVVALRLTALRPDLVAFDPATESVRDIVALSSVMEDGMADFQRTDGGFPLWYRLWTTCESDRILVHDQVRNEVRTFHADGSEGAPIALPPVRLTAVTPREFARATFSLRAAEAAGTVGRRLAAEDSVRLMNEVVARIQGEPHQLAAYLPRYVDMRCGTDGDVWLHPFDVEQGGLEGGPTWLRIAADGASREVRFPDGFDPFRVVGDRVWGVQRDSLDVAAVAWIDVP